MSLQSLADQTHFGRYRIVYLWPESDQAHCYWYSIVCGFFLACEDFGRMFDDSFHATAFLLLLLLFCFVFQEEFRSRTLMARRAETPVTECFLTSCV